MFVIFFFFFFFFPFFTQGFLQKCLEYEALFVCLFSTMETCRAALIMTSKFLRFCHSSEKIFQWLRIKSKLPFHNYSICHQENLLEIFIRKLIGYHILLHFLIFSTHLINISYENISEKATN